MIARLKLIRRSAGLPASAVAKAVGVSLQTVFNWESGKAHPRRTHMNVVHEYLVRVGAITREVTTGMLFDLVPGSGDPKAPGRDNGKLKLENYNDPTNSVPC